MSSTPGGVPCFAPAREKGARRPTIAVIGGGASATAFLCALVKQVSALPASDAPDVVVFEPAAPCGPGFAYRADTEVALLNRPVSAMSVDYADRGHFRRWLGQNDLAPSHGDGGSGLFVPRSCFGQYLTEVFETSCRDLRNLGGSVEIVREPVLDVLPAPEGSVVVPARSARRWADDVILCLGSVAARDMYGLSGASGYIHRPYPVHRLPDVIDKGAEVLVLGSGLTAIDVALELGQRCDGDITMTMASRSGALPDVRYELGTGDSAPELVRDTRALLARRTTLDLADLAGLLDGELARKGTTLRESLRPFLANVAGDVLLRSRLNDPRIASAVQQCIVALTPWYSQLWRALDADSRDEFLRRYTRIFTCLRSPMPPVNARRLLAMSDSGVLSFERGIADVRAENEQLRAYFRSGRNQRYDYVVNATGRGIDLSGARPGSLAGRLVRNGFARPHPHGGLDVDPDSNELLDLCGTPIPRLHVVGDLSSGVHFHTSSMEYVATQAGTVARSVAGRLPVHDGILL